MPLTAEDLATIHAQANVLAAATAPNATANGVKVVDWKAFIASLIQAIGPQLLTLLIALLSEKKTT